MQCQFWIWFWIGQYCPKFTLEVKYSVDFGYGSGLVKKGVRFAVGVIVSFLVPTFFGLIVSIFRRTIVLINISSFFSGYQGTFMLGLVEVQCFWVVRMFTLDTGKHNIYVNIICV